MFNISPKISGVVQGVLEAGSNVLKIHKASLTYSVTSVTVTTATDITIVVVDTTGATITKAYTWAAKTTVGALVDAINADGYMSVSVMDCLRSEATGASKFVTGTITATANGTYEIYGNGLAAGMNAIFYRLSADRVMPIGDNSVSRVHLSEIVAYLDVTGTATVEVYSVKKNVETKILTITGIADATLTTKNFASGQGFISANWGEDLVLKLTGTTITTSASNLLQVGGFVEKQ